MKKFVFGAVFFIIVLLIVVILAVVVPSLSGDGVKDIVCFNSVCFDVDVADSSIKKSKGLMGVRYLDEGDGMLFVYDDEGNYSFWMKNTLIPLDMIWIDENLEVVDIKSVFPCEVEECESYSSLGVARYVLEINFGLSEKYNISVGDEVRFF